MFPYLNLLGRTAGTYGICMALGFLLAGALSVKSYKKQGHPPEDVYIVAAVAVAVALLFGNGLYIIVTYPAEYILTCIQKWDFSFIGGGIVFYGGLIGGIAGGFLGARIARAKAGHLLCAIVPYIPLGHAVGRIGCLLAGCCYGMEYTGPLAVYYPNSILNVSPDQGYFPVQPLEAGVNVLICLLLLQIRKHIRDKGLLLPIYLMLYSVCRFSLEFLRGDRHRGIYFGLSLSQWISVGILLVSGAVILVKQRRSRNALKNMNRMDI